MLKEGKDRDDRTPDPKEEDILFNAGTGRDDERAPPVIRLKDVRRLRLEKERARQELISRLELVSRMYTGGGQEGQF